MDENVFAFSLGYEQGYGAAEEDIASVVHEQAWKEGYAKAKSDIYLDLLNAYKVYSSYPEARANGQETYPGQDNYFD